MIGFPVLAARIPASRLNISCTLFAFVFYSFHCCFSSLLLIWIFRLNFFCWLGFAEFMIAILKWKRWLRNNGLPLCPSTSQLTLSKFSSPAMLGFLVVQAGWPLALGGLRSCSSSKFGVWLQGAGGCSLPESLFTSPPFRKADLLWCWWSRKAQTSTGVTKTR